MNELLSRKGKLYGIRKRLLVYSLVSILVMISLVFILISKVVEKNIQKLTIEKYQYLNEKVITELKNNFKASDELFKKYIDHSAVQATLEGNKVEIGSKEEVQRMLAYLEFKDMDRATYIDNKGNVYGARLICFNYKQFLESDLYKVLDGSYSTTKWSLQKDTLFGSGDDSLFIMRYIRHMEYSVNPGVMILKMSDQYLRDMIKGLDQEVSYMFWDANYHLCYSQNPNNEALNKNTYQRILKEVKGGQEGKIKSIEEGVLFTGKEEQSQMHVAMLVPKEKIDAVFKEIERIIVGVWLVFCIVATGLVHYSTKGFISAIKEINDSMKNFDGTDYSKGLGFETNTELDEIAASYEQMLQKIHQLMNEVALREKALRISELNSLMYQINPHFLYNTLDNIYMMARLNHDESMEKMISALSKFLRIGLSNGKREITIEEELQHIKSYMEIMQLRGSTPFSYDIKCEENIKELKMIKLILQPIVENSIKYGLEGSKSADIEVKVSKEQEEIVFLIKDSGGNMNEECVERLNGLVYKSYNEEIDSQEKSKGGYGIKNVINRLKLKYGNQFSFKYESSKKTGTICYIRLPEKMMH